MTSEVSLSEKLPQKVNLPKLSPKEKEKPLQGEKRISQPGLRQTQHWCSQNSEGEPRRLVTCRGSQGAEPHARALHLQIHDREATRGHQLLQLFSQLQGKGQNEHTPARRESSVSGPALVRSAQTQEATGG